MIWTALLMGVAGGLHCAGMCGPLVLAATARNPFAGSKLVYNAGRVLTYGLLGLLAGGVGELIQISQYQNLFAYIVGGTLLLMGLGAISGFHIPLITPVLYRFTNWLKQRMGAFLKGKNNVFALGMLNGLLPCGLTYLALSYCFTLDGSAQGFLFMIFFGMGTVPVMAGMMWVIGLALKKVKLSYQRVSMIVLIAIGSLVIGRTFFTHSHSEHNGGNDMTTNEVICR